MPLPALSFDEFRLLLAGALHLEPDLLQPQAYFITDLGLDSIRLVELMLQLEGLGLEFTPGLAWRIRTVADAYRVYQDMFAADQP